MTNIFCFCACGRATPSYWEQKVAGFKEENKIFETGQIIFIGDSITDGYDLDKHFDSYALPLKLYNRGINGDTTSGLLNRMDISLFELSPCKIVILIGINDLNSGKTSAYVINNYREILNQIKTNLPHSQVYMQSIYPVNNDMHHLAGSTDKIIEVNSQLELMADEFRCTYIDVFSQLKTNENLLNSDYADDGLHPNHDGYKIITTYLVNYLN